MTMLYFWHFQMIYLSAAFYNFFLLPLFGHFKHAYLKVPLNQILLFYLNLLVLEGTYAALVVLHSHVYFPYLCAIRPVGSFLYVPPGWVLPPLLWLWLTGFAMQLYWRNLVIVVNPDILLIILFTFHKKMKLCLIHKDFEKHFVWGM